MKKAPKEKKINPENIMFAHLAKLLDEDCEINKLPQINLRCTHESYVAGTIDEYDEFTSIFNSITGEKYEYFKNISDVVIACGLGTITKNDLFAINACPITDLGITKELTESSIQEKLSSTGLEFNFVDAKESETFKEEAILKRRY